MTMRSEEEEKNTIEEIPFTPHHTVRIKERSRE